MNCEQCGVHVGLYRIELTIQPCGPRHTYCSALCLKAAVNGVPECQARLAEPADATGVPK